MLIKLRASLHSLQVQAHGLMYPGSSDAAILPRTRPWQQLKAAHSPVLQPGACCSKGSIEPRQGFARWKHFPA